MENRTFTEEQIKAIRNEMGLIIAGNNLFRSNNIETRKRLFENLLREKLNIKFKQSKNTFKLMYKLYTHSFIERIKKEEKEMYILFFELFKLSLIEREKTPFSLSIRLAFFIDEFKEFKDLYLISVFDQVILSLIENNRLNEMTDLEIIDEVIFQLI